MTKRRWAAGLVALIGFTGMIAGPANAAADRQHVLGANGGCISHKEALHKGPRGRAPVDPCPQDQTTLDFMPWGKTRHVHATSTPLLCST